MVHLICFLQCLLYPYHLETVLEMFHELFVIDPAVSIDISTQTECYDFRFGQFDVAVLQTLDVLSDLQEPVLIPIELLEQLQHHVNNG